MSIPLTIREQLYRSHEALGVTPAYSDTVSVLISHLRSAGGDMLAKAGELIALQRHGLNVSTADTATLKCHLRALAELVGELDRECGGE